MGSGVGWQQEGKYGNRDNRAVTEVHMSEDSGLDQGVDSCGGDKGWVSQMFRQSRQQDLLQIDWAWDLRAREELGLK